MSYHEFKSLDKIFMISLQHTVLSQIKTLPIQQVSILIWIAQSQNELIKLFIFSGFKTPSRRSGEDEKRDRGSAPESSEWVNGGQESILKHKNRKIRCVAHVMSDVWDYNLLQVLKCKEIIIMVMILIICYVLSGIRSFAGCTWMV